MKHKNLNNNLKIKRLIRKSEATTPEDFLEECYENDGFDGWQLEYIRNGVKLGLSVDQLKVYADPENPDKFNAKQMREILDAYERKFTPEQINFIANPQFNEDEMYELIFIGWYYGNKEFEDTKKELTRNPNYLKDLIEEDNKRFEEDEKAQQEALDELENPWYIDDADDELFNEFDKAKERSRYDLGV
jgi:hypothetical protein